jgi:hypothetical protein
MAWYKHKCPIAPDRKAWIEYRMSWLGEQFGLDRWRSGAVVLPTDEFFPEPLDGSEESIRTMLDRVCGYMDISPDTVEMHLYSENRETELGAGCRIVAEGTGSAGRYREDERIHVAIEQSHRDDPFSLAATMAHELAHSHLLGSGRVSREEPDQEPLTDLATVYFGMGVMVANAIIREASVGWHGWRIGRQGHLMETDFAYALAVYAWVRGEEKPAWAPSLRLNVRSYFKDSLRYIQRTGDCCFDPVSPQRPEKTPFSHRPEEAQ